MEGPFSQSYYDEQHDGQDYGSEEGEKGMNLAEELMEFAGGGFGMEQQ